MPRFDDEAIKDAALSTATDYKKCYENKGTEGKILFGSGGLFLKQNFPETQMFKDSRLNWRMDKYYGS
jgi:hypothetical protein